MPAWSGVRGVSSVRSGGRERGPCGKGRCAALQLSSCFLLYLKSCEGERKRGETKERETGEKVSVRDWVVDEEVGDWRGKEGGGWGRKRRAIFVERENPGKVEGEGKERASKNVIE